MECCHALRRDVALASVALELRFGSDCAIADLSRVASSSEHTVSWFVSSPTLTDVVVVAELLSSSRFKTFSTCFVTSSRSF